MLKLQKGSIDVNQKTKLLVECDLFGDILQSVTEYGFDYDFFTHGNNVSFHDTTKYLQSGGKIFLLKHILNMGRTFHIMNQPNSIKLSRLQKSTITA